MFKSIPKSDISERSFPVYKEWSTDNEFYPVISASNETGLFDPDTSNNQHGLYTDPLYHSIKSKYYSSRGNVFTQYGVMKNPADWEWERFFSETIYVIALPQLEYGEQIKKGSIRLTDQDNLYLSGSNSGSSIVYTDDSFGNLQSEVPAYTFLSYDVETEIMVFEDFTGLYNVVTTFFDANSGIAIFTLDGDTETYYISQIDFATNVIYMDRPLLFDANGDPIEIGTIYNGNAFYSDGLLVFTNITPFVNYTLTYNSFQTIHETEILLSATQGEFNYSQNPTAVNVTVENEYDFETTKVTNSFPAGTVKIKEMSSITQNQKYFGTFPTASEARSTGSWDDYFTEASTDPTGSYLATFVTTIGIYDADQNMVAVAKLPKAIKKLPNYDLNFLVRFDT